MAEMDEEMEETYDEEEYGIGAVDFLDSEIDFEYEFDAARYFDFCRPESPSEARNAELWFESAASCPPSPFITKIDLGEDNFGESIRIPTEINNATNTSDITFSDDGSCIELHTAEETETGDIMEYEASKMGNFFSKNDAKFSSKSSKVATRSTLMKPTASHLAKQIDAKHILTKNRTLQRDNKSSGQNSEKSCVDVCEGAVHAIKRQKLDGGHARKVHDLKQQMQQMHLVHKVPQKKEHMDGDPGLRKLKLTIPKDPDLGTARRAQRFRPTRSKEDVQNTPATIFRARPLNRKILEAPSMPLHQRSTPRLPQFQEFHLKTLERAMHHAASSSFKARADNGVTNRLQPQSSCPTITHAAEECRQELKKELRKSESQSINTRVLSAHRSKKELNPKTEKKYHQALPVDLFDKLSLISEGKYNPALERTSAHPSYGSKENITKIRGQDCKGFPPGEMRQKSIAGVWRQQSDASRSRNNGIR